MKLVPTVPVVRGRSTRRMFNLNAQFKSQGSERLIDWTYVPKNEFAYTAPNNRCYEIATLLSAVITHVCWPFVQSHRRLDFEAAHGTGLSSVSKDLLQTPDEPTIIRINSENNLDEGVNRDQSDQKKWRT